MATGAAWARRVGYGYGHGLRRVHATLGALPWADIGAVAGMVAFWRGVLWLFALLASYLGRDAYPPQGAHEFFARALLQGEALWYIWIGERGYDVIPGRPSTAAFPPLFPLLVRAVALLGPSPVVAGALVAHAATVAALVYLVALARLDADRPAALRAAAAVLLFPAAPFLGAVYPESTLLLAVTAALFHARRGAWGAAGVWSALAGLTRGAGLLVLVPLLVEYWTQRAGDRCPKSARGRGRGLVALGLAPLTFLAFLGYLRWRTGDGGAYFLAQEALGRGSLLHPRGLATFSSRVTQEVGPAAPAYPPSIAFPTPLVPALLDAAALFLFVGLGVWLLVCLRRSYGLFVLAGVAASFLIGGLPGSNRHLLVLAPAYLALALWTKRPVVGYVAAMLSVTLLAITMLAYVNGFWAG